MERYRKRDMLLTVDTLLRANDAIVRTAVSNPQGAAEALVQCQESAIALGTYIDTLDEKYAGLVHTLEEYCENIYRMSESLSEENICRKLSKKIQKQLNGLHNSIKYDMPEDKKEVVFLPYKASMWDSLESVWKAADADPDCDAYVIPIPYFDKNPDGSFKEEHYEGDQYPAYVPVTRYDEYDLEGRRPDAIYIHNPYDGCNHVTSVHPYFYSKNLRNFTDKLVYIPYFILGEIDPNDQAAVDGMKHFCFTPGTVYAHQVIVQSENMRQIYINEYMKAAKEMGLGGEHVDRKFLEKKFLGTGSPKIDKMLNTKKGELEIPEEWLKVIEKPDGSWKKIVFYNTGVSALLQHSEKMLKKMESVFEIFKENQDEVALLWRPHPLIQATIESMRPELWERYQEIRDRYVEEGWGIYDDSTDMDRAVVISDGYYGDHSSVIQLCEKNGEPTLIQNVSKVKEESFENAWLVSRGSEFDDENEILWMVTAHTSFLLKVDVRTGELLKGYQVPVCEIKDYDFMDVIKADGCLYLIPFNAEDIYRFDIKGERFEKIELQLSEEEKRKTGKFGQAFRIKDCVYIVGYNLALVITMNLSTLETKRIEGFWADTNAMARDGMVMDDDLYIPCYQRNRILHIKSEDDSWEEIMIENNSCNGFGTITGADQALVLTDLADHRISYFREEKQSVTCNLQMISGFQSGHSEIPYYYQYQRVYRYKKKEYYFPICSARIWVVDEKNSKKELQYEYPYDARMDTDYYSKFEMLNKHGNKIYFQARTSGDVFTVDLDRDEVRGYAIRVSDECRENLFNALMRRKYWRSINETDIYSLRLFIQNALRDKGVQRN